MAKVWLVLDLRTNQYWISDQKVAEAEFRQIHVVDINASRLKYIQQVNKKHREVQEFLNTVHYDAERHPGQVRRYGGARG